MDSYLQVALMVLRSTRRPMSARAILDMAYRAGVVPSHLYGKTQQKTLQARLSEDILHRREHSAFYRTEPGYFFLAELLNDPSVPAEWKVKFPARRRTRDLARENTLAVKRSFLHRWRDRKFELSDFILTAERESALSYLHPDEMEKRDYRPTWTFTLVVRERYVLSYRLGRYRDNRDAFANKRSIGFPGTLSFDDITLFSTESLGSEECSMAVLSHDLDISRSVFQGGESGSPAVECVTVVETGAGDLDLLIVLTWNCPAWFEPTTKRLSLNDPSWQCLSTRYNDENDFEPWSQRILNDLAVTHGQKQGGQKKNHCTTIRFP